MYRGYEKLGVNPFSCPVEAAILVWEWGAYLGKDAIEEGVDVQVSSWGRGAPNRFPSISKATAQLRQLPAHSRWNRCSTATPRASHSTRLDS